MTNAEALARHGCSVCFKTVYYPTDEEQRRGTCEDCHRRKRAAAVAAWRAFEDEHAHELGREV